MLYVGSRHCRPVHHRPELSRRSKLHDEQINAHLFLDVAQWQPIPNLALAATPIPLTATPVPLAATPIPLAANPLRAILFAPVATARHRCSDPATIATAVAAATRNPSFAPTAIPARSAAPLAAAA